jgi:hypothetical protein
MQLLGDHLEAAQLMQFHGLSPAPEFNAKFALKFNFNSFAPVLKLRQE